MSDARIERMIWMEERFVGLGVDRDRASDFLCPASSGASGAPRKGVLELEDRKGIDES